MMIRHRTSRRPSRTELLKRIDLDRQLIASQIARLRHISDRIESANRIATSLSRSIDYVGSKSDRKSLPLWSINAVGAGLLAWWVIRKIR